MRLHLGHPGRSEATLRAGLRPFADMVEEVHHRASQLPISESPGGCSAETITKTILESCNSLQVSSMIVNSITAYETSRKTRIVALRASEVYLFRNDEDSWTVVEWVEEDHLKCLAIFHFDPMEGPADGSWLMHSGYSKSDHPEWEPLWKDSRIDYNVARIAHLKILFGIGQHLLGILCWAIADAITLYCEQDLHNVSREESAPRLRCH